MGKQEIVIAIILLTIFLLIFIGGAIVFVWQYHKRKMQHEDEKIALKQQHQQALIDTQQQTMVNIGKELHDNVGQKLTLASIYLQGLQPTTETERISEISRIINDSIQDIRELSKSLVNPGLSLRTLAELLAHEARQVNQIGMCFLDLRLSTDEFQVNAFAKNHVYRLVQEFVQNSLKHARCKNIVVSVSQNEKSISINLSDDGQGFDTNTQTPGIGLSNIKRRANELQADSFTFLSEVNKGTSLHLTIPLS